MKIIEKGKLPGERFAQVRCSSCKTLFEFLQKEAKFTSCQREGDFYQIHCPLDGCGTLNTVYPNQFKER